MYTVLSNLNEVEERKVILTEDFQPNAEAIIAKADEKSKLLFICSPNNPTGNTIKAHKIKFLLENFKGLVVIDEAYIDFSEEASWITELEKYPNLVVTQTLSKAYGLAGIRLGLCFASEEIISVLKKIKPPYNVNELTQQKALERVLDVKAIQSEIDSVLAQRKVLEKALGQIDFVSEIYDSEANFVLAKVDNATERYNQLLSKGIVIRNRTTQPLCENTLRFTVGTPNENQALIKAMNEI